MKHALRYSSIAMMAVLVLALSLFGVTAQEGSSNTGLFMTNTPLPNTENSTQPLATPEPPAQVESSEVVVDSEPVTLRFPDECEYVPNQSTSQACINIMNEFNEPDVDEVLADNYTLSQYSFWRVGPQAVNMFDAPGGNVVGQIPQGFNFVNAVNQVDGWIQREEGQWISTNDGYYVEPTRFRGVRLPDDWQLPFGWILDTTGIYASKFPGGEPDSETGLVPLHYERFNLFAAAEDAEGWTWYLVGPDQWVKQIYMTVILPTEKPEGVRGRWVAVDLFEQSLVAYEDNKPVFATLISTGLPGTETNRGLFEVWARLDRDAMSGATGAPNAYDLASVPWVQYFDDSISLHGTYWHDFFGYRRSRGCVNLSISDAKWVYDFFSNAPANSNGEVVHYVWVHSSDEYRG